MAEQQAATPRINELDQEKVQSLLAECEEHFTKHVDEIDYRNFEWYLHRAHANFAMGTPIKAIMDDLYLAARCLHERERMHLELRPMERFLTRRIVPVELALMSGQPVVTLEMSAAFGLPIMMLFARSAPDNFFTEANLLTKYFRRGSCLSFADLAGFGATVYAGSIAAIGRGYDDEVAVALNKFADARAGLSGEPTGYAVTPFKRYDGLLLTIALILRGEYEEVATQLGVVLDRYLESQLSKDRAAFLAPSTHQRYIDLSVVALLAVCALRGVFLELPTEGPIARYRDFIDFFSNPPERVLEEAKLDYDSRKLLAQMGMDPDKVEADLKEQAAEAEQALLKARQDAAMEFRGREAAKARRESIQRKAELEAAELAQSMAEKAVDEATLAQAAAAPTDSTAAPDEATPSGAPEEPEDHA